MLLENSVHKLLNAVSSASRRVGLRQAVSASPVTDYVWRQARRAILNLTKESPEKPAAPTPPGPQSGPVDALQAAFARLDATEPRTFRAALLKSQEGMDIDPELKKLYSSFALSTVERGKHITSMVAPHIAIAGKRYLDVGCAYGGFLVTFHAAGAREVVGIDYAPDLLSYAHALVRDYAIPARVEQASILDPSLPTRLGKFDIITCNDVIEHVGDPKVALQNLAGLLSPTGLLCMEIPNRFAATFVRRDGHFYKFGLTSLPKKLADQRFNRETGGVHDVTYKSLDYYTNILTRAGLEVTVLSKPEAGDVEATLAGCGAVFDEVDHLAGAQGVDPETARYARRIGRSFRRIHGKWRSDKHRHEAAGRELSRRMALTFKEEFWLLIARPARS
jgi:2-polyprenyl-3-methyl-5-hydroxy-6-metoxy-1,4-benzoquinol methylase